mgnify:CR=1 FL=1
MKLTAFHTYKTDLCSDSVVEIERDPNYIILLHLLVLTRMNRWVCKASFKEFLTRLFLILDKPVSESFNRYAEGGVLLEGMLAEKPFQLTLEELLCFTGFTRGELNFHCWGTLEEFITDYQLITYDVWAEEIIGENEEDLSLGDVSEDWLTITFANNHELYKIPELSLNFKENLQSIDSSTVTDAERFAEFLVSRIADGIFEKYQQLDHIQEQLKEFFYAFTQKDTLSVDPEGMLYPTRVLKIIRYLVGSTHADHQEYHELIKKSFEEEVRLPESLQKYVHLMKFALGVKYGLIRLSDNSDEFHDCFDPRFEHGELSKLLFEPGLNTKRLFHRSSMESWLYLMR